MAKSNPFSTGKQSGIDREKAASQAHIMGRGSHADMRKAQAANVKVHQDHDGQVHPPKRSDNRNPGW
jgi:hypothetical protein